MVFRCLPNKHICSASYLIFRRGVLLPLLKHSHSNSHDLVGLPISQRKLSSWILASRPWVSCLGPKPQSGGIQRWVSAVISFRWLAAAEPFFNGTVCFFLVAHQTFKSCLALTRKRFPPCPSVNVAFPFWYWYSVLSSLVVFQLNTKSSQDSVGLCVSLKHQLTLSKSKRVNKGNHEPECL